MSDIVEWLVSVSVVKVEKDVVGLASDIVGKYGVERGLLEKGTDSPPDRHTAANVLLETRRSVGSFQFVLVWHKELRPSKGIGLRVKSGEFDNESRVGYY